MTPNLICTHCGKRLSRKRARMIDNVIMCSACMFAPQKRSAQTDPEVSTSEARGRG